jgi:hypothetical protein
MLWISKRYYFVLKSYLVNRTLSVNYDGTFSNKLPIKYGDPKGHVLGPPLINLNLILFIDFYTMLLPYF